MYKNAGDAYTTMLRYPAVGKGKLEYIEQMLELNQKLAPLALKEDSVNVNAFLGLQSVYLKVFFNRTDNVMHMWSAVGIFINIHWTAHEINLVSPALADAFEVYQERRMAIVRLLSDLQAPPAFPSNPTLAEGAWMPVVSITKHILPVVAKRAAANSMANVLLNGAAGPAKRPHSDTINVPDN